MIVLLFSVLWLEVEIQQNSRRMTVIGCQNGHVKVAVPDLTEGPSMNLSQADYMSPVGWDAPVLPRSGHFC